MYKRFIFNDWLSMFQKACKKDFFFNDFFMFQKVCTKNFSMIFFNVLKSM